MNMKLTNKLPQFALIVGGIIALSTFSIARAQNKTLADVLGLTKEQRVKLEAIDKKYQPKTGTIMKKYEPRIVPIRQQVQALEKKYKPRISAIQAEFAKESKPLQDQAIAIQNEANKELKPLEEARRKDIESVLTPAQREKVKKIDAQRLKALQAQQAAMKKSPQQ
jgi:Spy/CpxP family protein refolding chaperone